MAFGVRTSGIAEGQSSVIARSTQGRIVQERSGGLMRTLVPTVAACTTRDGEFRLSRAVSINGRLRGLGSFPL